MTEQEARQWLEDQGVSRETLARLDSFAELLVAENAQQNLVAASTLRGLWSRHIVDSGQLVPLARPGTWLDLGSGAGFPGLIVARLGRPATLLEARAKRIGFLRAAAAALEVERDVAIVAGTAEKVALPTFDVISARAFAPLPRLLALAHRFSHPGTCWLLPKGRNAAAELAALGASWQGEFRLVPSITDSESGIIVATNVRPGTR